MTAEQYRRMISLGPEPQTLDIIAILENTDKDLLPIAKIKDYEGFPFGDLIPEDRAIWKRIFTHKGTLYGIRSMEDLTLGELIDLMEWGKDMKTHLISMMTLLWRPVTKIKFSSRLKAYVAHGLLKTKKPIPTKWAMKIMNDLQYEIEDYIPTVADGRVKAYKGMPSDVAHFTTVFMLTFFKIYSSDTLLSMTEEMQRSLEKVLHRQSKG